MRFSVVLSFLIAIALAGGAVYVAQQWLASERALIESSQPAQAAQQQEAPSETIVVASEALAFGERLDFSKLREVAWAGDLRPEGSYSTIAEVIIDDSEENARFALTSVTVGEPILTSKITEPGVRAKLSTALTPGMKAVSIRVNDVLGVAGFVLPGDRVDVMLARDGFVDVLLQGVKVLAIDQIADDRKDQPSVVRTITFEVNTTEAQKLTLASQVGILSLALRNLASTDVEPNYRVTIDDLSDLDIAENLQSTEEEETVLLASNETGTEEGVGAIEGVNVIDHTDERLTDLEMLIRSMSGTLEDRLATMETKLQEPEPEVIREQVEVVREVVREVQVPAPPPPPPVTAKVGVIRNGQRVEYKVDARAFQDQQDQALSEENVQQLIVE